MTHLTPYYGGATVESHTVAPLGVKTFRELVDQFFAIPVTLNLTRGEFLSMDKPARSAAKDGPYVTACSFTKPVRNLTNMDRILLVFLDIDTGKDAAPFLDTAVVMDALPYNHVVYTTANHTPQEPRIKVMVEVLPCDSAFHTRGVRHVASLLGLPHDFKGNVESRVMVQPQYRPVRFLDDGDNNPALISRRTNGRPLDLSLIAEPDAPDATDKHVRYAYSSGDLISDLAFLPLMDLTVEGMREPLFTLDADAGYAEWTHIACALRHQFRDEESAREAFEMWDEWSATGSKYPGREATLAKWLSFSPEAEGRDPVTIRSLFHMAQDKGWSNRKIAEETKGDVMKWIAACESETELIEEGIRRIAALPFSNRISDAKLLDILRKRIKEVGGTLIKESLLHQQLGDARYIAKKESVGTETPHWLNPFCYASNLNKFINGVTGTEMSPEAFNLTHSDKLMPSDGDSELAKAGKPMILPMHYAVNVVKIPKVDGTIYDPRDNGAKTYIQHGTKLLLNLFKRGSIPKANTLHVKEAGELFTRHIRKLIREKEYGDVLIDYIAYSIQNPGKLVPWIGCIQSGEGAGKGTIKLIIKAIVGPENTREVSSGQLESEWTDWMAEKQWVFLEEVHTPGAKRTEVAERLKQFISDPVVPIKQKFRDAQEKPNISAALAFTNHRNAFAASESSRRLFWVESALQTKAQITAVTESGHYDNMEKLYKDPEWSGSLRTWFLKRKISKDFPVNGPAPATVYLKNLVVGSKNKVQALIERIIADPTEPLVQDDLVLMSRVELLTAGITATNQSAYHTMLTLNYQLVEDDHLPCDGVWVSGTNWTELDGDPVEEILTRTATAPVDHKII